MHIHHKCLLEILFVILVALYLHFLLSLVFYFYLCVGEISVCVHFLFVPQLVNFLYSVPQLFGFVPCPRHRLTVYNHKTDTLTGIPTNMNLLNLSLRIIGPTNEGVLCEKLLIFQILCSAVGIVIGGLFMWRHFDIYTFGILPFIYLWMSILFLMNL